MQVNIIRISQQLENFQEYQQRVSQLIGAVETQRLVKQSLVLITLGGNDFVNNYFLTPFSARSRQFTIPNYVRYLISEYQKTLLVTIIYYFKLNQYQSQVYDSSSCMQRLVELGARRVLVTGTGPLGCVPAELAMRSRNGECAVELQQAASLFDPQLTQMLVRLNSQLGTNVFIAANTKLMNSDFIQNPQAFGFITSKVACCGQGPYNGLGLCTQLSNLCRNRDVYAFWDAFHPSERANRIIVSQIMTGSSQYMNPMNLSTIMALDSQT